VAVEAALVTPILVLFVFGIIEMSFLFRDYAVVTSNVRTGARIASTGAGDGPAVDCTADTTAPCSPSTVPLLAQQAADAIQRTGSAMPEDYIDHIVVFKANDAGFPGTFTSMPDSSSPCGGAPNCVVYQWRPDENAFRYVSGTWPSASISACFPGTSSAPLDRVGVGLQATHQMMTGIFGTTVALRDHAVMNFEPLPAASCQAGGPAAGGHL
jgi:hypothetical protein